MNNCERQNEMEKYDNFGKLYISVREKKLLRYRISIDVLA